jgi:hypothetical protein
VLRSVSRCSLLTAAVACLLSPAPRLLRAQSAVPKSRVGILVGALNRDVQGYRSANTWGYSFGLGVERRIDSPSTIIWSINASRVAAKGITIPPTSLSATTERSPSYSLAAASAEPLAFQGQGRLTIIDASVGVRRYLIGQKGLYGGAAGGLAYVGILGEHSYRLLLEPSIGYAVQVAGGVRAFAEGQSRWMGFDLSERSTQTPRWILRPVAGLSYAF